jgi:prephenate dehydratase
VLPCATFDDAFTHLRDGDVSLAMLPIENTVAGRVADIHRLLPGGGLYIIGEYFMRINHCLLALPGTQEAELTHVHSHEMALGQCRNVIAELGLTPMVAADTAGAARDLAAAQTPNHSAIASELAAEIYGLDVLRKNIEDSRTNTTRFLVMSASPDDAEPDDGDVITSFIFRVRNVPAALYKALGGFATNNVNMTKLESYQPNGFLATQFYADIEGHPQSEPVRLALEELNFYCSEMDILGVYKAAPERADLQDK